MSLYARMAARAEAQRLEAERDAEKERVENDPHAGHHQHFIGLQVYCSCGEYQGLMTGVVVDDMTVEPSCHICGERGVWSLRWPEPKEFALD